MDQSGLTNAGRVAVAALRSVNAKQVLDFGCGGGTLVEALCENGFDAFGCDIGSDWPEDEGSWIRTRPAAEWRTQDRLFRIQAHPYRLPFDDASFDAVVSVTVFEHIQDKAAALSEIQRVLKPGGYSFHQFPSRWVLPLEPHTYVPLASWFQGAAPLWWWRVWAFLGIRNPFQKGKGHVEVAWLNRDYARANLFYLTKDQYEGLAPGQVSWGDDLAMAHSDGLTARIARALRLSPNLVARFRNRHMVFRRL